MGVTASEQAALIGRDGLLTCNGLKVPVRVLDVKRAYGNTRYQVTPILGGQTRPDRLGKQWIDASRITLMEK